MTLNDEYIIKCLNAGLPFKQIAAKLGMTEDALKARWEHIQREIKGAQVSGYYELSEQFRILAHQYQLLGESLKIIGNALGNVLSDDQLRGLISVEPEQTLENLRTHAIILRPFKKVDPAEALRRTEQGN